VLDSSTGRVVTTTPGETARMYVCGITPYDATHIGHAATYVAFDLLNRAWRDAGHAVRYVQNVTDVDDPLLQRARETGRDWQEIAQEQTALFAEDMSTLGVLPPDVYLGAVEGIPLVVAATGALLASDAAYRLPPSGDVYFAVTSDPAFGAVSGLDAESMRQLFAERGGDPDRSGKRSPLDPVLWRAERPGEPSWDGGLLGPGRPGWHIECTTIALEHLGPGFDVQGGGSDLRFPHHEMSAAHAHALRGAGSFARAYMHSGMVALGGEKMSKSKGNLVFVSRLRRQGVEPAAIRVAILSQSYRQDWEWTDEGLGAAVERLNRWRAALSRDHGPDATTMLAGVREHISNDLDAPAALDAVDRWADAQLADGGEVLGAPGVVARTLDALLGVRV
jgi:L-cysteine:1D-myo-inositol 2-amino-2-deoxy-alpha-D-glucopyranoside ligase